MIYNNQSQPGSGGLTPHTKHIAALARAYRNAKTPEAKEKLRVKINQVKQREAARCWLSQ